MKTKLKFGTRVMPANWSQILKLKGIVLHGVVVAYHGRMAVKSPRVRWSSGWATSTPAKDLIRMPLELRQGYRPPQLYDCDLP